MPALPHAKHVLGLGNSQAIADPCQVPPGNCSIWPILSHAGRGPGFLQSILLYGSLTRGRGGGFVKIHPSILKSF